TAALERPFPSAALRVPDAIAVNEGILWWAERRRTHRRSGRALLEQFIRLHREPPAAVEAFARRWGVLRLCTHGLPCTHRQHHTTVTDVVSAEAIVTARLLQTGYDPVIAPELAGTLASGLVGENESRPCVPIGWDAAKEQKPHPAADAWEPI